MGILDITVFFGFCVTFAGLIGVYVYHRVHLGLDKNLVALVSALVVAWGWAYLMTRVDNAGSKVVANAKSSVQERHRFQVLLGVNVILMFAGATIAWALVPLLRFVGVLH